MSLDTFTDYGLAFAQAYAPELEAKMIVSLSRGKNGFSLRSEDGEIIPAKYVVVAIGIAPFAYMPANLSEFASVAGHHIVHYIGTLADLKEKPSP